MSTDTTPNSPNRAALCIRYIAILLLILLPVSALGTRFGLWHFRVGLILLLLSMAGSVLVQVINAIWLLRKPAPATRSVLRWACLFALPPLVVFATNLRGPGSNPMIHNISTNTNDPPAFVAAVTQRGEHSNPLAYSREVAAIQREAYPDIETLRTPLSPPEAFQRALDTATDMGWEIYAREPDDGRIEAVDTTFWFGFRDDVVIRIKPAPDGGSLVDLRSVSRVGKGDIGKNAQRIKRFLQQFTGQ